jgi:hypothetical protein
MSPIAAVVTAAVLHTVGVVVLPGHSEPSAIPGGT